MSRALLPSDKIYLADSRIPKAGRGIFAVTSIAKDEIIERCPVLEISKKDAPLLKKSELVNHFFVWGAHKERVAIALGYGSIYNHSYEPNATYKKNFKENLVDFLALKDIPKDEEITVNYNYGDPNDKKPLWIKSIRPYQSQKK